MGKQLSPLDAPSWMRWVERRIRVLDQFRQASTPVPVAGAVLWVSPDPPPPGWLLANGAAFDEDVYPELANELGASAVPTLAPVSGRPWIIRAE